MRSRGRSTALVGELGSPRKTGAAETHEEIVLRGQPALRDYLEFTRTMVIGGAERAPRQVADEWRAANDHYALLETREAGLADAVDCRPLDAGLAPLAAEVEADPRFRATFDTLATEFAMVELDRLVVYQTHVARRHVADLQARLGRGASAEDVFRLCMPLAAPTAPLTARRVGPRRYVFTSPSMDVRCHEPVLLRPEQVREYQSFGDIAGIAGVAVGFSCNLLNVIRSDRRLLLHNGYHRACALRALGISHAPAIVQTVTRRDELDVIGPAAVVDNPAFYFRAPRPPLLKDFFDPKIRKVVRTQRILRVIEISFEVREFEVAE